MGRRFDSCRSHMTEEELKRIHRLASRNKDAIGKSKQCGCFYCKQIFPASQVETYVLQRRDDDNETTATCPFCFVDSVLADSQVELSESMLVEMSKKWFRFANAKEIRKMQIGDLVITDDGYYAIVTDVTDTMADLFLSNGLQMASSVSQDTLRRLPLKQQQSWTPLAATANFAELVRKAT